MILPGIPILNIDALNGDVKPLFIDAVHALIGQNIQKVRIKALPVRPSPLQQRIALIAPNRVGHGNGFILAFRFAVKYDIEPGQGSVLFGHTMRIIIIPASDRFAVGIVGEEDRAAWVDKTDLPHGIHDFRAIIILCVVHVIQVTVIVQLYQGAMISDFGCTDRWNAVSQNNYRESCQ